MPLAAPKWLTTIMKRRRSCGWRKSETLTARINSGPLRTPTPAQRSKRSPGAKDDSNLFWLRRRGEKPSRSPRIRRTLLFYLFVIIFFPSAAKRVSGTNTSRKKKHHENNGFRFFISAFRRIWKKKKKLNVCFANYKPTTFDWCGAHIVTIRVFKRLRGDWFEFVALQFLCTGSNSIATFL